MIGYATLYSSVYHRNELIQEYGFIGNLAFLWIVGCDGDSEMIHAALVLYLNPAGNLSTYMKIRSAIYDLDIIEVQSPWEGLQWMLQSIMPDSLGDALIVKFDVCPIA